MGLGDFWLQSNSNNKGKKFSLKDLQTLKPEDIAKNPKLQKLITLFDSDGSGNLEINELQSVFSDLKSAAKDDILSDSELGLYLSDKFKDKDVKVDDVKELLNAASSKELQVLNYTDLDGNNISDKYENGELVERTITNQDDKGNKIEVNVFYENKKPVKQLQIVNNKIVATISYDYSKDSQNPTTTTIFKNKDGIVEEVNTPQKRTLTLYKTESIDDFNKTKNHRLQQVVVTDKAQFVAEYDGKGNTYIIVQNSETPELIAQKFGIRLADLIRVNKGLTRTTTLQAGQKLIVPSEINADSKVMKPRKSEGEVKQRAVQHAFGKVYDKIFASAIDEYEIKSENAGKDVYEYATKYLIRKGAKKTDPNFNARVNDLANELIALNGKDAKYTAGSKIKYIKKTLNQSTINQLKDAGMTPSQENQLFFARFNYLTPQQQTNVIEVLKQCKSKGITEPQKINSEILRYYPEIQMFETDKKVLQKPTKAMARSYMAHYLLEQIDAIIAVYNQTATADQSLMTLGTGLIVELQDLLHISTKFINDNLGTCIAEGDSRVNLAPMLNKIREECLALVALAEHEEQYMDESFDKKKNAPGWEGSAFDEHFNKLFYGKNMNYDAVTTYLQAVQEFQKAPEKDRNNKNSQAYKKIEAATNKLNQQLPGFQDIAKRIEGWSKVTQIVGGLTDLGVQVAMLYLSGGGSAIARSSMYVGNATRYSVGAGMSRMAASRLGSSAVGKFLVKDGTQFITREGSAILASMVTSSAETAAFFQGTKVAGALQDGKIDVEEAAIIQEGFEGLFKFGMIGSAIAGPLGAKASELTSKLLNSEKAIASTMRLAVEGNGTTLDKVLKALCENSNAVSKITEFGTSFSINSAYLMYDENEQIRKYNSTVDDENLKQEETGYLGAMGNMAQMDAVSKLVVAMLGGKNTAFLTPQKVQQIKTSLAGYEVKLSVYKGQKIYEITDKAGAKTRLANEQELFMFIVDREVAELTRPNVEVPRTDAWDRFNVTIKPNEELADNSVLTELRGTIDQELSTYESQISQIKEQLGINGDLKLELQNPQSVAQTFGDDLHLRLTDKENNISFKFDKKTGKLVAILTPNEAYNVQNGTFVRTHMEKEFRAEDIMPEGITEEQRRINSTPTYMEMFVSKDGKQYSHEEFVESKVTGEFEIYDIDPNGKKYKIGLAELMPDGGKYVEKTLTSLDGTKTDYVYKDDATGNRFLYYKITDSNGKVLFETTKKYKVLSENHYQTATNGEYYDVEILEDKVVVTRLDNAKNKTSEKIEYRIEDFTEEDYVEINEKAESSVQWGSEERRKENITNMLDENGIGNTVDRKILPMLKQLSGEEWFKLSDSGARLLIGAAEGERNAGSIGGIIKLSDGLADLLAVFEHEAGHEIFHHLRLSEDAELKKIYEEEKAAYTSTFTDDGNLSIAYFLRNNHDDTNRGINETVAETNLLTNMHQQENSIQARSALLQHYFPRTLAHIANKLNHATTRAAIESHIDANGRLEKGYIIDERSNQPIKVDTENLQVEKQSAADGRMGFVNITDKFGNNLGYVNYNLVEIDGQKSLHFEGLVSNVEGVGIGSKLIQELTLISRDLGAEGRLTASASPMANKGGKLTNIEFYYKLGFKASDPAKDAAIREYIDRGEEVPLQLNIFTEIELGPKFAKVNKNITRTDLVEKLQQTGFSEEDIQTIKEKASNVDGALTLIDLLSSTAYKNNAKKLLTDEFFEGVNSTRFDFTKLTIDELNKIADNLGGRHSVDELSQYLFRYFVRGSETMDDVSVRIEILDKIKVLEEEFGNPIDITDSWSLRPDDFKEASVETIIFTAKVAKALGDKTVYAEDFKRFAEVKEYTEQDIADVADLSGRVKLISFHDKTSLSDLVGVKNLFDNECKADIRKICEIIENTQAGKLTENSFRRLMRGEVKDAELFAQILKNRKENNNASSQEAIPTIIGLIEKYPDYKQDLIDICDYSSRTDDFTKIIELWQNNSAEKDVIKQLAIAKRNINQINIVLPLLNTPNRASVLEIVLSKNIKFESADDIQAIIDIKTQNQDIAGTLQTYLSINKISFGVEDANKFVEFVNKNPENRDFILRMAENSNMDVNAMERVIALQEQYKNDAKKLSLIDYLATDGKFDLMTILRTLEDVQTHSEFEDIISTNRTVAGFIDSSNENKSSVERNSARAIAEDKANPADIALLKDMLGDYYDRLKWESMVDSKMTATQINEVVNDLIEKSTAFTRISFVERNYGKNPIWASSVQKTMNKAVVRLQRGESFQEVLDNIATDYQNEARSHSKPDEPFNQTGVRRGLGDREIGFSWTKYDDVLYSEYKDRFDAISRQYGYEKPSPYEDVKLTQIDGKKHQMDHPYDKGGSNADNAIKHCEDCYAKIQPLIEKINNGEKLTTEEMKIAKDNIAEIHFLLTNAMPYTRGSAGIADCLTRSIYKALGEEAPILKKGVGLDLEAFARNLDDYQANWDSFFVERSKQNGTETGRADLSVDELRTAIRSGMLSHHEKANERFINQIFEICGDDLHKLNNMKKLVDAGYHDEVCKDMAKYMDIPEDILDGLLSKTRINDDKFGYGLYSLVQQLYDGNGLKENYLEILKTINHLLNQKDEGISNLSARNIATIVKLSDGNVDKANIFLKYMNIEELGNKQLEPEAIGQIIDFLYPQPNPEVESKLLYLLKLTPEQMQTSDGIVLDGYFIKTILKDNFTNEQIDIVKSVLYDKDLAGLKPSEAMSVARDLDFNNYLINMFKELYSTDLHPKSKFERSKVEPNIARMIVRNYQDANIIGTIKYLLENNATKTENSSKLKEQNFVDGSLSKDDLTRMSEYLELIKDNQDLKSHLNFDFVRRVERFDIVKTIISENKDITYQELKTRIEQKELEIKKEKYRQDSRLIANEELKNLAVEMEALSRHHKSLIPEMEDISFKLDGVEDDFVMAEIRKLLDECAENVKQANTSFEYINNIETINMYLDIYHTLKSDYEYIGTRSELTPKREYYNYVTKNFGDKDVDGKFVQSAENRFKSAIDDRIAEDFEAEGRIERLKHYSLMFPKDKVINHFYKEYYLKEVPEEVRQICANISDKYNTKLFLSSEGRENAPIILNFVENEFAEWHQKSNGKAIFPDVIDLTLIDKIYVDEKTAYGQGAAAGSSQYRKITLAGYSNVVYALRHELTHYNEALTNNVGKYNLDEIMPHKIVDGVEVPDFENCKYKEEFLRAGINPRHIDYAYNNTQEFIAVASEGDMSKYSPEFKQMLIDFGMHPWEFDLNITNPRVKQRSEYVDYLLEYGEKNLSIADENGNPIEISKNFKALGSLVDIYEDCIETAKNVAMEMRRHNVPNDPKKLFEYVVSREDREDILHDWSLVSRVLTGEIENDNATLKEFLIKDLGIAEDKVGSATDNVYIKNTQLLQNLKARGYDSNFINEAIELGVLKTEVGGKMLEKLTREDPTYQSQLLMFLTEDRIETIKDRNLLQNEMLTFNDIRQLSDVSNEDYAEYKNNGFSDVDILIDKFPANIKGNAVKRKLSRYKYLTISEIRDLARLSDEEFARLEATHKVGTGLVYTSEIPAIDDLFIRYKRICPSKSSTVYLKQLEKEIVNDIKTNSLDATSHVEKVLDVLSNIQQTKNFDRVSQSIVVISSHLVAKGFDTNTVRKFVQLGIDEFKNDVNQEQFPLVVSEIKNHAECLPLLNTILQKQELSIQDIGIVFTSINNSGNRKQSIELFKQLFTQNPKLDKSCFLFNDDQYKLLDHDLETNLNSPEALALINLLLRNDTYTNKQKGLILGLSTDFNADINKVIERVKNNYDANSLISYLTLDIPKFADALFDKISGMKTKEGHSVYSNIALSEIFKRITSENDVARLEKALSENQLTTKEIITFLEKGVLPAKTNARPFESFVDKVKATQVYKDYPDDSVNYTVMDSMREIYNKDPKNFDLFLEVFDFYAKTQAHISKPIGILWMFTKNSTTLSESLLKDLKKQKDGIPLINKYNPNIALNEIVAKSQNGDIISRGNELYLVNNGKASRINLKAETFEALFPLGARFDSHQGHIGDCWLVKSIDAMMNNIKGQSHIYNLFRQEGNDIIVTIPNRDGQSSFSVRFKDGFVFNGGVNACNGVKLLETAFALSDRGRKSSNGTVNYNDIIKSEAEQHEMLEKNITSGNQSEFIHTICGVENYSEPIPMGIVLDNKDVRQNIEIDGKIKAKRTNDSDEMVEWIEHYANEKDILLHMATEPGKDDYESTISKEDDLYHRHAYEITGFDSDRGLVYYKNPWHCNMITSMDVYNFIEHLHYIEYFDMK